MVSVHLTFLCETSLFFLAPLRLCVRSGFFQESQCSVSSEQCDAFDYCTAGWGDGQLWTLPADAAIIYPMSNLQNDFWQTIFGRRSIRRYRPEPVPRELLERLLTAAIWAPSAHNRQPWRFAVITDTERKEALAAAMARRWRRDLIREGWEEAAIRAKVQRSRARLTQPPVLVVGCLTMRDMDAFDDPLLDEAERVMAIQSVALALGNLMLAAHHEGLSSCWLCAPLFAQTEVRQALDLPADWQPQAIIALGWPDETRESERRPLEEVVVWQ